MADEMVRRRPSVPPFFLRASSVPDGQRSIVIPMKTRRLPLVFALTVGLALSGIPVLHALYVPPVNPFITGSGETITTLNLSSNSISDVQTQINAARNANANAIIVANLTGTYEVSTAPLSLPSKTC